MRKMRLDVDSLAVESFDTAPGELARRGTVRGHDTVEPRVSDQRTCLCPETDFCIPTQQTACGQGTCTCPAPTYPGGGATCTEPSCGLTLCVDSCDYCMSISSQAPQYCTPVPNC